MFIRFIRSSYRIPAYLVMTMYHFLYLVWIRIRSSSNPKAMHQLFLRYTHNVHRLMGIRITFEGELPDYPSILMGNHRSYIDAVLIPAKHPVAFVARSESKYWPIIGWGARAMNTIWVHRKSQESRRRTREQVKLRLQDGFGVVIFPEGTTHKGPDILEYRPSMFYISAEGGFPVTPIAIEYKDPNIAWVGKVKFIPHAWKQFGKKHTDVRVTIGETVTGDDGQKLLDQTRNWTILETLRLRNLWDEPSLA
ncbi:MAG: lysophospholipid acyltransferase family protein [Flavobacteriales bacterium]|nr:lysophospholipid acyltransferase family protein [Flavobacteriales bacterium]